MSKLYCEMDRSQKRYSDCLTLERTAFETSVGEDDMAQRREPISSKLQFRSVNLECQLIRLAVRHSQLFTHLTHIT